MTPRYDVLPTHKGADEAAERLSQSPEAELQLLLPERLGWLMDSNWPVARPVWELLLPRVYLLVPDILAVLAGTEDIWKANLLYLLKNSALPVFFPTLRQAVERIAHMPTSGEHEDETDEATRELLARYA